MLPHHRRDVSGPQAERPPLDVLQERGAVLGQAVDEGAGQGGGHLQELVRVEERSHCGVEAGGQGGEAAAHEASWRASRTSCTCSDLQDGPRGLPPHHHSERLLANLNQVVWIFRLLGGGGNGDGNLKPWTGRVGDLREEKQEADQRHCELLQLLQHQRLRPP